MSGCNYGCATLADHQQVICNEYPLGGISAAALLECDHTITDFSNAVEWQANIDNRKAFIFKEIKGDIPTAAPASIENPVGCGTAQVPIGMDNTLHWRDSNVLASNDDLYANVNGRKMIVVFFMCEQEQIRVSSKAATITAIPVTVPGGNREVQYYDVSAMFYSKKNIIPMSLYTAPEAIFESEAA